MKFSCLTCYSGEGGKCDCLPKVVCKIDNYEGVGGYLTFDLYVINLSK